jgi:hypothetical protein
MLAILRFFKISWNLLWLPDYTAFPRICRFLGISHFPGNIADHRAWKATGGEPDSTRNK